MGLYQTIVRKLAFRIDPETVHNIALQAIAKGVLSGKKAPNDPISLLGVEFPNKLGLAAGFDKNGVALDHWHKFGFGFVEVGTVTFHPQPGNPKPRMFRLPSEMGLINRLGFNNHGAEALAKTLENARPRIPYGVNIGKSKIASPDEAAADYLASFKLLHQFGAYAAVNVSSPNTLGLRDLQEPDRLRRIIGGLREVAPAKPILVKIAPDLAEGDVEGIVALCVEMGLQGVIATNTTIQRDMLAVDPGQTGGLSGAPLLQLANQTLETLQKLRPAGLAIVAVGGIMNRADYLQKLSLGADLCQTYTGWVYGGPAFARDVLTAS